MIIGVMFIVIRVDEECSIVGNGWPLHSYIIVKLLLCGRGGSIATVAEQDTSWASQFPNTYNTMVANLNYITFLSSNLGCK